MRGLVLSGGGVMGAFQAGVLESLIGVEAGYDVITGISVGALNASFLAQAPNCEFDVYVRKLKDLWFSIEGNYQVWDSSIFGMFSGLWKTGFRNFDPLRGIIRDNLDLNKLKSSGRKLRIGAVDLVTKKYVEASEMNDNIEDWILGSCSAPIFFQPVEINGGLYVDGGIKESVALQSALSLGCSTVHVIVTGPVGKGGPYKDMASFKNVFDVMIRSLEIMIDEIAINDYFLGHTGASKPSIKVFAPSKQLIEDDFDGPFDFSPSVIRKFYEEGLNCVPVELSSFMV